MANNPAVLVLNDVYNLGFEDGYHGEDNGHILSLIEHLSHFEPFHKDGDYDLMFEYHDGLKEGKYARTLNLPGQD